VSCAYVVCRVSCVSCVSCAVVCVVCVVCTEKAEVGCEAGHAQGADGIAE
jgi:hypothetical protein